MDPRLVDGRRRIALPKDVLRALDLRPGDYVAFRLCGSDIQLVKVALTVARPRMP